MSCGFSVEWLHRKIDGELTPEETNQLDDHLVGCTECREYLSELDSVGSLLREAGMLDRPTRELSAGDSITSMSSRRVSRLRLPTAAALLFAACVFLMNLPEPAPVDREPPVASVAEFEVVSAGKDVLAVYIPSKNPDVHIVWLYSLDPEKGRSQ